MSLIYTGYLQVCCHQVHSLIFSKVRPLWRLTRRKFIRRFLTTQSRYYLVGLPCSCFIVQFYLYEYYILYFYTMPEYHVFATITEHVVQFNWCSLENRVIQSVRGFRLMDSFLFLLQSMALLRFLSLKPYEHYVIAWCCFALFWCEWMQCSSQQGIGSEPSSGISFT